MEGMNATEVAKSVVNGLSGQPIILAIVVLNIVAIVAAAWFLDRLSVKIRDSTQTMVLSCIEHLSPRRERE